MNADRISIPQHLQFGKGRGDRLKFDTPSIRRANIAIMRGLLPANGSECAPLKAGQDAKEKDVAVFNQSR